MNIIATNIYLFIMALVLALLEIQIEGKNGWARNLPTWRPSKDKWHAKLYSTVFSGKELTGYHIAMFTFVFLIFNLPYVFGIPLTLENWLKTVSIYFTFSMTWDFLWFVFNPNYPITRFGKEDKINHLKWVGRVPVDYFFIILASLAVLLPAIWADRSVFAWWAANIGLFALETFLAVLISLYILKIPSWHHKRK